MADENTSLMSGFDGATKMTDVATPPQPSLTSPDALPTSGAPLPAGETTKGTVNVEPGSAPPEGYDEAVAYLKDDANMPASFIASADPAELIEYAASLAHTDETTETESTSEMTDLLTRITATLDDKEKVPATEETKPAATTKASDNSEIVLLKEQVALLVQMAEHDKITSWVARSKDEYPTVVNAEVQEKVTRLAIALRQAGSETDVDRALDRATKIIVEDVGSGETMTSRRAYVAKLRSKGSLTPPADAGKKNLVANMTTEEVRDKQLELIMADKSDEGFELGKEFTAKSRTAFDGII